MRVPRTLVSPLSSRGVRGQVFVRRTQRTHFQCSGNLTLCLRAAGQAKTPACADQQWHQSHRTTQRLPRPRRPQRSEQAACRTQQHRDNKVLIGWHRMHNATFTRAVRSQQRPCAHKHKGNITMSSLPNWVALGQGREAQRSQRARHTAPATGSVPESALFAPSSAKPGSACCRS